MDWKAEPPISLQPATGDELCELSTSRPDLHEVCRAACDYTSAFAGYAAIAEGERAVGFGLLVQGEPEDCCALIVGTGPELRDHAALPRLVACLAGDARRAGFRWMTTSSSFGTRPVQDLLLDAGVRLVSSLSVGGDSHLRIDLAVTGDGV